MDRHDALKELAAAGVGVSILTEKQAENAVLLVAKYPGRMNEQGVQNIRHCLEAWLKGTPLEGVKCMVLTEGVDLEVVTRGLTNGR